MSSPALLVVAYGEMGHVIGSSSENGTLLFTPYTEDDDAKTRFLTPARLEASRTLSVPTQLTSSYMTGSCIEGLTPALAAMWQTASGPAPLKTLSTASLSLMSSSWSLKRGFGAKGATFSLLRRG